VNEPWRPAGAAAPVARLIDVVTLAFQGFAQADAHKVVVFDEKYPRHDMCLFYCPGLLIAGLNTLIQSGHNANNRHMNGRKL